MGSVAAGAGVSVSKFRRLALASHTAAPGRPWDWGSMQAVQLGSRGRSRPRLTWKPPIKTVTNHPAKPSGTSQPGRQPLVFNRGSRPLEQALGAASCLMLDGCLGGRLREHRGAQKVSTSTKRSSGLIASPRSTAASPGAALG
jgi:hypothetical protein